MAHPDSYSKALTALSRDGEPHRISRHQAGLGGAFRHGWAHLFFIAFCLGLAAIGFFVPAREGPVVGMIMGIIGLTIAAIFLVHWIYSYTRVIKDVEVFQEGVLWCQGGRWHAISWDDIRALYRTEVTINGATSTKQIVLKTDDGREIVLTHILPRWNKMAEVMQLETTVRIGAEALEAYEQGETVQFADQVGVNRKGLVFSGKLLRWENISDIRMGNGTLMIVPGKGIGEVRYLSFGNLPNYLVFLKLLELSPAPEARPFS